MSYTIGEALLTLNNISLSFGPKLVLRDINAQIRNIIGMQTTGQVVTLLGRSGIGKSQLFRIIAGLVQPTSGSVFVGANQEPVKAGNVGMVLQNYPLFAHRTLLGNLQLVCDDKAKIETYMNEFDIYEHRNKYPPELSGGQRQRAAIIQQVLCSEHFILLDEPFSGLDPVAVEKLCKIINKIASHDDHNTVIISSHIIEPSVAISDTVWMLGNNFTPDGVKIEGAVIRHTEDLAAQGLAWRPDIRRDPRFGQTMEKVRSIFLEI